MDEARFLEQLVELGAVGLGHLRAQRVAAPGEVALAIRLVRGAEDGADQHLGHLERVLVGDVVARDEAVADLVEIRLQRLGDAGCRLQIVQDLLRRAPADAVRGDAARGERGPQAFERRGADAARDRRGALEHAEHFARRQARPALHFRHEVAHGKAARNREDVVPVDHLDRVGPDVLEVREELRVAERGDRRVLELAVARDRIRLDLLVPAAHVLAPELLREDVGARPRCGGGSPGAAG